MMYDTHVLLLINYLLNGFRYDTITTVPFIATVATNGMVKCMAVSVATIDSDTTDSLLGLRPIITDSTLAPLSTPDSQVLNCKYDIITETEVIVTTCLEQNSNVTMFDIYEDDRRRRKRRSVQCPKYPDSLYFTTTSSKFDLKVYSIMGHRGPELKTFLVMKMCLYPGYSEVLEVWLRSTLNQTKINGYRSWKVNVQPTIPDFIPPGHDRNNTNYTGSCTGNITVVSANKCGSCSLWNCSVRCKNYSEHFWIENGITIMAASTNIEINHAYELTILCNETAANLQGNIYESIQTLEVVFSSNCTTMVSAKNQSVSLLRSLSLPTIANISTTSFETVSVTKSVSKLASERISISARHHRSSQMAFKLPAVHTTSTWPGATLKSKGVMLISDRSTAESLTTAKQTEGYSSPQVESECDRNADDGFLDDPRKVSAVALTGGMLIGVAFAVGCIFILCRLKLCPCVPAVLSSLAEEDQRQTIAKNGGPETSK